MPQASFPNLQSNNLQLASNWNIIPQGSNLKFTYNGSVVAQLPAGGSTTSIPTISFLLNGKKVVVENPDADMTLLSYLRNYVNITSVKKGCNQGGCGICAVMLSYKDINGTYKNVSVTSCLVKLVNINGFAITTNDGIGNVKNMHPIQKYFANIGGLQCGFCTNGQVMNLYTCFQTQSGQSNNGMNPTWAKSEKLIDGNLCRCTGYRPIIEVLKTLMVTDATGASSPYINPSDQVQVDEYRTLWSRWHSPTGDNSAKRYLAVYNPANDTKNAINYASSEFPLTFSSGTTYYNSADGSFKQYNISSLSTISDVIIYRGSTSNMRIVQGNLQEGVPGYRIPSSADTLINIKGVPALHNVSTGSSSITVGSAVTIAEMVQLLSAQSSPKLQKMAEHMYKIAGHHIRNWGSWVGGLYSAKVPAVGGVYNGSYFTSDMALVMQGANAVLSFYTYDDTGVPTAHTADVETFLKTAYSGLIVITSVQIPFASTQIFRSYRQAMRIYNSHAIAQLAIQVTEATPGGVLSNARVFVGAVGEGITGAYSSYYRFTAAESALNGNTIAALQYSTFATLVDTWIVGFTPEIVSFNRTLATEQIFRREELKGFFLNYLADIKDSTTYDLDFSKDTAFGLQQYANYNLAAPGNTDFDDTYATNLFQNTNTGADGVGDVLYEYYPMDKFKTTGEALFTADKTSAGQLYMESLISTNTTAPFFNIGFTGAPNAIGVQQVFNLPCQVIDFDSPVTQNVIATAKNIKGVAKVMTWLDYKPYHGQAYNYESSGQPLFDILQGAVYNPTFSSFGTYKSVVIDGSEEVNNLTPFIPHINTIFGAVVAETPEIALSTAFYISNNIAYVSSGSSVSPKLEIDIENPSNNISFRKEAFAIAGPPIYTGNYFNTGSSTLPAQIAYYEAFGKTGVVGNFTTAYASATGVNDNRIEGSYKPSTPLHFTLESQGVSSVVPKENGKIQVNGYFQAGSSVSAMKYLEHNWYYGPYQVATGPYAFSVTGKYYYSPSGPATYPDGSLVYDASRYDLVTASVGAHFGSKLVHPSIFSAVLACQELKRPILLNSYIGQDTSKYTGHGQQANKYQLAFDNSGRMKALNHEIFRGMGGQLNGGCWTMAILTSGETEVVGQEMNFGAFQQNIRGVIQNQGMNYALRSVTTDCGHNDVLQLTQTASEILQYKFGSTGASLSQVLLKNLVTPYSPFTLPVPSIPGISLPENVPCDNFGYPLAGPVSFFNDTQAPWKTANEQGQDQGYWDKSQVSQYEVISACERKLNELYYTTGAKSVLYPNGYTGGALAIPVAPSNTGVAYDNLAARFPALYQLEQDVKTFNARAENKFKKLGVAASACSYKTTSGYNIGQTVKINLNINGNLEVRHGLCDSGHGSYQKLILTIGQYLYLDTETTGLINLVSDSPIVNTTGFTSAGSIASLQGARAGKEAAIAFLAEVVAQVAQISTIPLFNYTQQNIRNVIPEVNKYDVRPWTGAGYAFPYQIAGVQNPSYSIVSSIASLPQTNPTTGSYNVVAAGPYTVNYWYTYVGTGAGTTGPASNPASYSAPAPSNGVPQNYCTQGWPSAADVAWVNSNRDLQILTLIRFAQQAGMGDDQLTWAEWTAMTQEQKTAMMTSLWPIIANGLMAGGPSVSANPVGPRYPIAGNSWYFSGGLKPSSSSESSVESLTSPPDYYFPQWAVSLSNPDLYGFPSVLRNFWYVRGVSGGIVLTQLDIVNGTSQELESIICLDAGQSVAPLNDTLQLEGGYLQGRSWYTQEDVYFASNSELLNKDTWDYKPMCAGDAPQRITSILLNNPASVVGGMINKTKPTGETPVVAGPIALAAIRAAIGAYRRQEGFDANVADVQEWMEFCAAPITINKIKNVCPLPASISL